MFSQSPLSLKKSRKCTYSIFVLYVFFVKFPVLKEMTIRPVVVSFMRV